MRSRTCCSSYVSTGVSKRTRTRRDETHLIVAHGTEHVLEKTFEVILAFSVEEGDDAGNEGGADAVLVAFCITGERVGLVETGDGGELCTGMGKAGGACVVLVVMERGGIGERAERGGGPEEGNRRGSTHACSHHDENGGGKTSMRWGRRRVGEVVGARSSASAHRGRRGGGRDTSDRLVTANECTVPQVPSHAHWPTGVPQPRHVPYLDTPHVREERRRTVHVLHTA